VSRKLLPGFANLYVDEAGTLFVPGNLRLKDNNELRFYDNGNYVGFEPPALSGDQIWVLPTADGSAGNHLQTDGAGNLSWAAGLTLAVTAKVNDYTATASDAVIIVDASANTVTITLPTAVGITGKHYTIKCIDATFAVDVDGAGAETIDGELTQTLSQWDSITVVSDSANWIIV